MHRERRLARLAVPRTLVAQLVSKLDDAGASVIAFDILFAEPDRLSPADTPSRNDPALARAIAGARVVAAFGFVAALATVAAGVWYGYTGCRLLVDPGGAMIAVLTACLAGILSNALRAAGPARS